MRHRLRRVLGTQVCLACIVLLAHLPGDSDRFRSAAAVFMQMVRSAWASFLVLSSLIVVVGLALGNELIDRGTPQGAADGVYHFSWPTKSFSVKSSWELSPAARRWDPTDTTLLGAGYVLLPVEPVEDMADIELTVSGAGHTKEVQEEDTGGCLSFECITPTTLYALDTLAPSSTLCPHLHPAQRSVNLKGCLDLSNCGSWTCC